MSGIEDVARAAGVSTATVSRALSGRGAVAATTRQRVLRVARDLGYVASSSASSLASGRTRTIGVVVPALTHWFWSGVVEGAEAALREHDFDLALYNVGRAVGDRERIFDLFLRRRRVDAVLTVSLELQPAELTRLLDLGKPVVGVGGPLSGLATVSVDDTALARLATEHLLDLGHRRIGHIGGDAAYDHAFHVPTARRDGYEAALRAASARPDPALHRPGDFTIDGGYDAARDLLRDPGTRPTAIFAVSDEMAIGAIAAARDLGLDVPGDVSVIGVDDHSFAAFFGLTTVAQHPHVQGRRAAELLLAIMDGEADADDPVNIPVPFELVVRSSTAPPR